MFGVKDQIVDGSHMQKCFSAVGSHNRKQRLLPCTVFIDGIGMIKQIRTKDQPILPHLNYLRLLQSFSFMYLLQSFKLIRNRNL